MKTFQEWWNDFDLWNDFNLNETSQAKDQSIQPCDFAEISFNAGREIGYIAGRTATMNKEMGERKFIGLCDKNGNDIYAGDKMRCKVESLYKDAKDELVGTIDWAKYKAGYSLQNGDMTIAAFRCITGFGVAKIKELPDGRIDGVILNAEYLKNELDKLDEMMIEMNNDNGIACAPWLAQPKITKMKILRKLIEMLEMLKAYTGLIQNN